VIAGLWPDARQIPRSRMACCSDPARLHSWFSGFFFTHLPFTLLPRRANSGFHPAVCSSRKKAPRRRRDARVSSAGESKNPGGSSRRAVFFFTLAGFASRGPLSQGVDVSFPTAAQVSVPPVDKIVLRLQKSIASIPGINRGLDPDSCTCKSALALRARARASMPTPLAASCPRTFYCDGR